MTDDKSRNGTAPGTEFEPEQPKNKGGRPKGKPARDAETGLAIKKDGTLQESNGSGPVHYQKIIPPADMQHLVEIGVAPNLVPNWDRDDPDSNWYVAYRKFTPERKQIFLQKLEQTGRITLSCRFAGINKSTVERHRKEDPDFDAAVKDAEAMYHEMCVAGILHQARMGQIDERYDSNGNILSRRVTYETQLRKMIVQRGDPTYQDTQRQEVAVTGGAVVVPAPIDSVESWEDTVKRYMGTTVDTTGSEVSKPDPESGPKALEEGRVVKRTSVPSASEGGISKDDGKE